MAFKGLVGVNGLVVEDHPFFYRACLIIALMVEVEGLLYGLFVDIRAEYPSKTLFSACLFIKIVIGVEQLVQGLFISLFFLN